MAEAKVETARAWISQVHTEFTDVDHAIFDAVQATRTPTLDGLLVRLSNEANNSRLWLVTAAAVAAFGGPRGRRATAEAVLSIGMASAVSNIALKGLGRRRRPPAPADGEEVASRQVRRPTSPSFPSGHSASAFAFASIMGEEMPATWLPLHLTATLVGYSRVHTGVHYPSDVVVGSVVGALCGWTVRRIAERVAPRNRPEEGRRDVVG